MPSPSRSASTEKSAPSPSEPTSPPEVRETTQQDRPDPSPLFQPATPPQSPEHPSSLPHDESPSHVGDDPVSPSALPSISRTKLRELRDVARRAVQTIGGVAHELLTRDGTPEREVSLYVPDDEDVEAISEPLAGLASRRLPEGPENPDIADLFKLGVGLLGYALKQKVKRTRVAQMYAAASAQPAAGDDQGDDAGAGFPPTDG